MAASATNAYPQSNGTLSHLCPSVAIEIALFRLPLRQREVVRRYDLARERAQDVQRALGLSRRQFFRDHSEALRVLNTHVTDEGPQGRGGFDGHFRSAAESWDQQPAGKAYAASLAQSGNPRCLDVLHTLAANAASPFERADLLLELASTAADYGDEFTATDSIAVATQLLANVDGVSGMWLHGRLARLRARLVRKSDDKASQLTRALALLRRSVALNPSALHVHAALVDALGAAASLHFEIGAYARSRAESREAADLIERFGLRLSPKPLEILALHAAIGGCVTGRTRAAAVEISSLFRLASESAWSSTAYKVGSYLVGLHSISSQHGEAIAWYRRMMPLVPAARSNDRADAAMELAHAFTMSGRQGEALSILRSVKAFAYAPSWHVLAGEAMAHVGDVSAIAEARLALGGYDETDSPRGLADAHRLLAVCYAKRGEANRAREHIAEARRLTERYGTPYALLLALAAEATIVGDAALRKEASEYAQLLKRIAVT